MRYVHRTPQYYAQRGLDGSEYRMIGLVEVAISPVRAPSGKPKAWKITCTTHQQQTERLTRTEARMIDPRDFCTTCKRASLF